MKICFLFVFFFLFVCSHFFVVVHLARMLGDWTGGGEGGETEKKSLNFLRTSYNHHHHFSPGTLPGCKAWQRLKTRPYLDVAGLQKTCQNTGTTCGATQHTVSTPTQVIHYIIWPTHSPYTLVYWQCEGLTRRRENGATIAIMSELKIN